MGKPVLVLDLDNTLVFSTTNMAKDSDFDVTGEDGEALRVIKRPGVDEFLKRIAKVYRVVVYSAGKHDYVNEVVDKLDPERKIVWKRYTGSDCEISKGGCKVKDLNVKARELGLPTKDFSRLVWVDDVPEYFQRNQENGITVTKFEGEKDDAELQALCPLLVALAKLKDFRRAIALCRAGQVKLEAGTLLELDVFTEEWVPVTN